MTKDKLRLLLFDDCNRNCPGCCNRDWDLQALPLCQDYTPYRLIMLTGGEPMLYPEIIREAIAAIRRQTNVPIYLYTAMPEQLDALMPLLDGVTVTLHTPEDIPVFQSFDRTAQNLTGKSLRLNVFDEVGTVICRPEWQVKDHMRWIPNCPLPEGEVLMRYQPSKIRSQDGGIPNEENSSHLFFRGFGLLQGCLQVSRYSPLLLQS